MSNHPAPDTHLSAEYLRYMDSPEWADVRTRFYRLNPRKCAACGETDGIDLHHRTYINFTHEHLNDLVALCRTCHEKVHLIQKRQKINVFQATLLLVPMRPRPKAPRPLRVRTKRTRGLKSAIRKDRVALVEEAKARLQSVQENEELVREQIRLHRSRN